MTVSRAANFLIAAVVTFAIAPVAVALAGGKQTEANTYGGVDAPGVRAAVVFLANPGEVVRSKGVAEVVVPTKGIYCIRIHKKAGIADTNKTVPVATGGSEGTYNTETLVIVGTAHSGCTTGKRWLAVTTYEFKSGAWEQTDNVSWNLIVP